MGEGKGVRANDGTRRKISALTAWDHAQYPIRALDKEGEQGPAALLGKLGALGENARDLAYRLYTICKRKSWAQRLGIKIPTNVTMRMLKTGLFAGVC